MQDHYKTLGINSSATLDEIRRAYRILARRYHPDVNPGKASEDKFKAISSAYSILGDAERRQAYDLEYEKLQMARFADKLKYSTEQEHYTGRRNLKKSSTHKTAGVAPQSSKFFRAINQKVNGLNNIIRVSTNKAKGFFRKSSKPQEPRSSNTSSNRVSIIEVSINIKDAIYGLKKTIEISEPSGPRKVSVQLPAGVRNGSVIRLQERNSQGAGEEIVLIVRLSQHPFISIQPKGLIVEIPVSIAEALQGANITLPTLDEPAVVRVAPGSQSGTEIRLKGKGIVMRDGTRGDLVYRLMVKIPESPSAVGIGEKVQAIDKYYEEPVRRHLPSQITG